MADFAPDESMLTYEELEEERDRLAVELYRTATELAVAKESLSLLLNEDNHCQERLEEAQSERDSLRQLLDTPSGGLLPDGWPVYLAAAEARGFADGLKEIDHDWQGTAQQWERNANEWRRKCQAAEAERDALTNSERFSYDDCRPDCDCGGHQGPGSCGCHITGGEARSAIRSLELALDDANAHIQEQNEQLSAHWMERDSLNKLLDSRRRVTEFDAPCRIPHPDKPELRCVHPYGHGSHFDGKEHLWLGSEQT